MRTLPDALGRQPLQWPRPTGASQRKRGCLNKLSHRGMWGNRSVQGLFHVAQRGKIVLELMCVVRGPTTHGPDSKAQCTSSSSKSTSSPYFLASKLSSEGVEIGWGDPKEYTPHDQLVEPAWSTLHPGLLISAEDPAAYLDPIFTIVDFSWHLELINLVNDNFAFITLTYWLHRSSSATI